MRFEVAPRSATSMIDSLESSDLVRRTADPTDRRSVLVGLTPQGVTLMERVRSLKRTSAEGLFGRLSLDERQGLLALLTTLCETDSGCSQSEVVPAAAVVASRQVRGAGIRPSA
jgi:DNA-binding MarR family transcriptional regulator